MKSKTFNLEKISSHVIERIIRYCYVGRIGISIENVKEILEAACILQIKDLFNTCLKFVQANLDCKNAFFFEKSFENLSYTSLEIKNLQHRIRRYILKNFDKIMDTVSFLELDSTRLVKLLKQNQLNVENEEQVRRFLKLKNAFFKIILVVLFRSIVH